MLRIKDRKQQHLFDPWQFLSPKRRQILEDGWPGFFRNHILELLPVEKLALAFPSEQGRPTKELHTVLGALTLQQSHDLTDQETCEQLAFNLQRHYALDIKERMGGVFRSIAGWAAGYPASLEFARNAA